MFNIPNLAVMLKPLLTVPVLTEVNAESTTKYQYVSFHIEQDMKISDEDYVTQYLRPAIQSLANEINSEGKPVIFHKLHLGYGFDGAHCEYLKKDGVGVRYHVVLDGTKYRVAIAVSYES